MAEYERKLQDYKNGHGISGQVVTSGDVVQRLEIDNDPGIQLSVSNLNNIRAEYFADKKFNGVDSVGSGRHLELLDNSKQGSATLTFTNTSRLSYMGRKISKVVEQITLIPNNPDKSKGNARVNVAANLYWGYDLAEGIEKVTWSFYDENGRIINFTPNTAYLSVASLNNYANNLGAYSIETTTVDSGGKALSLYGSSVTSHGNSLYSNKANSYNDSGIQICGVKPGETGSIDTGFRLNPSAVTNTNIPQGWDRTGSPLRYYGSGLISLEGPALTMTIEAKNTGLPNNAKWRDVMWWNAATLIPQTPGPQKPKPKSSSIHYHYDTAKISRIPGTDNVNATYHYDYTNYNPSTEKHFTDGSKIADNQVFSDGSVVTANIKATLPVAADIDGGLKSFTITEDYSNFAKYVNKGTFKVMNGTQDVTSQWSVKDDGNGKAVLTLIDPSKANGETVTVEPMWTINTDVPNGTEFVNKATATVNDVPGTPSTSKITTFTQQPTKDVEMGDNVQGDTPNSINGQVVAAGSTVTYPLSDKNGLPANREQQVTSHVITDNLDSALNYVSYKAYLPDSNGKLQDVTSHVLLTKDGQNLTFTDDSYLLGLYNQDPSVAFALPIIDLVVKANNDTKVIPNNFNSTFTYKDNNGTTTEKKTSNTVNISTYTPSATKDVELGDDVQGDTSNTIAGSLVEAGTLVTWPMSTKSLPANRVQDVVSHTETENLDNNLSFISYKAYLPDKDGKLQDVTSHVQMKQDGQKLTFTDDATLIKQYNADKKAEQSLPVIDLVTKVNGQSKLIPNDFDSQLVFKDGKGNTTLKTTSNKVSIKTATAPNPVKEDLNDQGKNIDGQEVNENQHLTMQLDWDLSNDKGVNATPEMIKKGFYFADPLDAKALEAGDLSKAQVLDQNGNKVSGISFHKYNSLSEAPEFIQEQIKDNDLAARFNGPFVVAQADDPQAFYDKYVKTGSKLKVQIPVTVKKGFKGSFSNTAYQFGFGKATPTNTVTNFVKPTPKQETPKPTTPQATPTATPVATPTAPAAAPEQLSAPVSQQQPEAQQSQLPQTGNTNDAAILGLAAAALIGSASLAGLDLRKHN